MRSSKSVKIDFNVDISAIHNTLQAAAEAAAQQTLPMFRNAPAVDNKLGQQGKPGLGLQFDPVTQADRAAEIAIRAQIESAFPDHTIIGEEHDNKLTDSPFSWIIDPIDGTRAFITGVPVWGTLIGVAHTGRTFAGLMSQPFTGETYVGLPGESYYQRHGSPDTTALKVSQTTQLAQARLFTTTPALFTGKMRDAYNRLEDQVMLPRYGCDCYAYCLLASGHVDLVVETALNTYDIAALIPIIENAGGIVTTFEGKPADDGGNVVAAATPQLHAAALETLNA